VKVLFFVHDRKKATKPANNKVAMAGPASRKNTCSFIHLRSVLVQADKPIDELRNTRCGGEFQSPDARTRAKPAGSAGLQSNYNGVARGRARTLDYRPTTNGAIMNGNLTTLRMGIIGNRFVSDFSFEVSIVVCGAGFAARPRLGTRPAE